jgi:hypothetical protein
MTRYVVAADEDLLPLYEVLAFRNANVNELAARSDQGKATVKKRGWMDTGRNYLAVLMLWEGRR